MFSGMKTRAAVLLAAVALLAATTPAGAQSAPEVVAEGLNGPQGVLVAEDGMIWVIDTGLGGDDAIQVIDTESGELVDATLGNSARILAIDPASGEQTVAAELPSVATPGGGYGGARMAQHQGQLYATVGEWATPDTPKPDGMATIMAIGDDATTVVADTWQHEVDVDPYPRGAPHSHPYGMATAPDGRLFYVDAGGNALMAVDPSTGDIETVAVFEPLPGVFPRPDYDGEMLTDPVPTSVVVQDGRIFVSLLSGAPFVPGNAKVVEVGSDGSLSDHATGLTMLTDLRAGPDGNLYATQFAIFGEQGPAPGSGAVVRILPDGSSEPAVEGLDFVTSVDFDADGNAYIAANGVGPPGSGVVVRVDGVASAAPDELPTTGSQATVPMIIIAATLLAAGGMLTRFRLART